MQNYQIPEAVDVTRAPRVERLSMTDELRHQSSLAYTQADADLQLCKRQISEAEKELADIDTTEKRKKSLKYKLVRLMAKRVSLLRALEKATGDLDGGAGGQRKASDLAPWVERRLQ